MQAYTYFTKPTPVIVQPLATQSTTATDNPPVIAAPEAKLESEKISPDAKAFEPNEETENTVNKTSLQPNQKKQDKTSADVVSEDVGLQGEVVSTKTASPC